MFRDVAAIVDLLNWHHEAWPHLGFAATPPKKKDNNLAFTYLCLVHLADLTKNKGAILVSGTRVCGVFWGICQFALMCRSLAAAPPSRNRSEKKKKVTLDSAAATTTKKKNYSMLLALSSNSYFLLVHCFLIVLQPFNRKSDLYSLLFEGNTPR